MELLLVVFLTAKIKLFLEWIVQRLKMIIISSNNFVEANYEILPQCLYYNFLISLFRIKLI
jgi:hypothetical protein